MTDVAFWDRIAPKYAARPVADPGAYEETLNRVRTYLRPEDRVLELGCGTGTTALKLCGDVASYLGTDISPAMLEIARGKAGDTEGVQFRTGSISGADYGGELFDVVMAFSLLHLVPDMDAAVAEIHKLLPKGGYFISKTAALKSKWYYRPVIWGMQLFSKAPLVRFLGVDEIDRRIEAAGFEIVETGLLPPTTPARFVVARKI